MKTHYERISEFGTLLTIILLVFWTTPTSSSSSITSDRRKECRSRGTFLDPEDFARETCALCYKYMPRSSFNPVVGKWRALSGGGVSLLMDSNNRTTIADERDENSPLLSSFIDDHSRNNWIDCCVSAKKCCDFMLEESSTLLEEERCPPTWDGWQCWPGGGSPGTIEYQPCPEYIYFRPSADGNRNSIVNSCDIRYAEKSCLSGGQWFQKSPVGGEWTDYTTCGRVRSILTKEYLHIGFYTISILALVPAISIFLYYKVLRVPRIAIHKNLFSSLFCHCFFMVLFKTLIIFPYTLNEGSNDSLLIQNTIGCRFLVMLTKYFRLTNYTWMFCEGYYLHRLLAKTFEEERSVFFILAIGWGFPVLPCLVYGVFRLYLDDTQCWALPAAGSYDWIEWIYMVPGLVCILANFVFFINIFRILVTKLQAPHANEPTHFRKAVRATVVLLPLFGLHWLLALYRPQNNDCFWVSLYKYMNISLDGLQGIMVAIAFCYRNGEIRNLLKQSYENFRDRRELEFRHNSFFRRASTNKDQRKISETCFTRIQSVQNIQENRSRSPSFKAAPTQHSPVSATEIVLS